MEARRREEEEKKEKKGRRGVMEFLMDFPHSFGLALREVYPPWIWSLSSSLPPPQQQQPSLNPISTLPSFMPPEGHGGHVHGQTMSDRARHFFTVPAPIKRIFDRFPLTTLPPNDLPRRSTPTRQGNKLFVFTDPISARHGRPSFNPQCLKWQVGVLGAVVYFARMIYLSNYTGLFEICWDRLRYHSFE